MGKEKLLIMSNSILFPQCFQRLLLQIHLKPGLVWEGVEGVCKEHNLCDKKT